MKAYFSNEQELHELFVRILYIKIILREACSPLHFKVEILFEQDYNFKRLHRVIIYNTSYFEVLCIWVID